MSVLGIDASNLRHGGGRSHLINIISNFHPGTHHVKRIVVWGSSETLSLLPDFPFLYKSHQPLLDGNLFQRTLWQLFCLHTLAQSSCDILLIPGTIYFSRFQPTITYCQNLLPFDLSESSRYGISLMRIKWFLLRHLHSISLVRSNGIIFLSQHSLSVVSKSIRKSLPRSAVIGHGTDRRFLKSPRKQRQLDQITEANPFRILYVSTVDQYKHQWNVVKAVSLVRTSLDLPITLELVGSSYPPALRQLKAVIELEDPNHEWVFYRGPSDYRTIEQTYHRSELFVWASTCETFGIILLEAMSSGLPIACSSYPPMPDIAQDSVTYFNPIDYTDLVLVLRRLILSPELRADLARKSYMNAKSITWNICATQTYDFIDSILCASRLNSSCT